MIADYTSSYVELGNGPLHVADFGGQGHPIVLVHGLGGAHVNWVSVAGRLQQFGHVTAVDLPGFGLTPLAGRGASLGASQSALNRYLRSLAEPVTLVGNSMGCAISLLQADREPDTVSRLILVSPAATAGSGVRPDPLVAALFTLYSLPFLGPVVAAARQSILPPEKVTRWLLDLCSARPDRLSPQVVDLHIDVARRRAHLPGNQRAFLQAARSTVAWVLNRPAFDRRVRRIEAPVLVVHGEQDRLVPCQATYRLASLRPDWRTEVLEGVGHIAMLETPIKFSRLVAEWMESSEAA